LFRLRALDELWGTCGWDAPVTKGYKARRQ
jgi:hypothetical protein